MSAELYTKVGAESINVETARAFQNPNLFELKDIVIVFLT